MSDPAYADAGAKTLAILEARRKAIGAPAISAAVAIKGEIVWAGASGWADVKGEEQATPETIFRIGSTAKALTGTRSLGLLTGALSISTRPFQPPLRIFPIPLGRT